MNTLHKYFSPKTALFIFKKEVIFFTIIFSLLFSVLFSLFFFASSNTFASGLTYAKIGEKFSAELENAPYKSKIEWVLTSKGDIIETSHKKEFSYTFTKSGNFSLRATTEDIQRNRKTTVFDVISVSKIPNFQELKSSITTLPAHTNGVLNLSGDEATVIFAFTESSGEIAQYEIDTDIFSDSDENGEISDDIDNKNDPSYLTGGTFSHTYKNTGIPARARLRVIDKEGNIKESFLLISFPEISGSERGEDEKTGKETTSPTPEEQQEFIQNNTPNSPENSGTTVLPSGATLLEPVLFASRSEILEGQTATFEIYSAPENAKYSWDFDGDGIFEIEEGTETKVTYKFADSGHYAVEVWILESGNEAVIEKREIIVGENFRAEIETFEPVAHFSPEISGNEVVFKSSQSQADENMFNTDISYSWDFGDGFKTEGSNPKHIYQNTGKYNVILIVEDSLERKTTFTQEIIIEEVTAEFSNDQHGGQNNQGTPETNPENSGEVIKLTEDQLIAEDSENSENSETGNTGTKNSEENSGSYTWIWWILGLIIFIPLLLLIPLLKMKIDDPDKDFSDIFTEFFSKKKQKKASEENSENTENIETAEIVEESEKSEVNSGDTENNENTNNSETPEENIFSGNVLDTPAENQDEAPAETPDWMKSYDEENKEDIQENSQISIPETVPAPENTIQETETTDIPDWLKGGDSPMNDDLPDEEILETPVTQESEHKTETQNTPEIFPETTSENSDDDIPDWLKGDDEINKEITPEPVPEKISENTAEASENPFSDFDHPDWLNDIKEDEDDKNKVSEIIPKITPENIPEKTEEEIKEEISDDLPDWLKSDKDNSEDEKKITENILDNSPEISENTENSPEVIPEESKNPESSENTEASEIPKKKKRKRRKKKKSSDSPETSETSPEITSQNTEKKSPEPIQEKREEIPETETSDDLPDWLKSEESKNPESLELPGNTEIPEIPKKKKRKRRKKKKSSDSPELSKSLEISETSPEIIQENSSEQESILAKDARLPRKEDSSEIPEWLRG